MDNFEKNKVIKLKAEAQRKIAEEKEKQEDSLINKELKESYQLLKNNYPKNYISLNEALNDFEKAKYNRKVNEVDLEEAERKLIKEFLEEIDEEKRINNKVMKELNEWKGGKNG